MAKVYDYDIGIIGGGAAGLTVAAGTARLGLRTLLVEKEPRLGGDCLHTGCVPSKALIKAASVYHAMRTADRYGLPAIMPPPVDYSRVAARIRSVIDEIQVHDSEERFCGLGVRVVFGEAAFEDDHVVDWGDGRASARYWVIATGSGPVAPDIPGLSDVGYWTNEDVFSLDALPSSLMVLGGGPLGCEMAQSFSRLGVRVTLLQRNCQLLPAEDADMAQVVGDALVGEGVDLALCAAPREVRRVAGGVEAVIDRDGRLETVRAERLLVAAGRAPRVGGLRLENAGVEYGRRGIVTDARLRTSRKHIFAAGDVLGKYQFTHAAGYEGSVVIANVVFRLPRKVDYTWLPWCTYTQPELASVGMNEKRAQEAGADYTVWQESFADNDRARAQGAPEGKIKLLLGARDKPLGVQIVGPHAGEVAAEWVAALNTGAGLSAMASAVHPYPTVSEISKRVAGSVFSSRLFSDKVRKTLAFFFDYKGRACTLD
jgi:pyruvate/2-oxoglutarate dehydrogenase complex dihydrolipoamide dehydrogenase (E3) component